MSSSSRPPDEDSPKTAMDAARGNPAKATAMVLGGLVAASGPAVVVAGVALNQQPTRPPVEAFVAGAGLATVGIATVLAANALM